MNWRPTDLFFFRWISVLISQVLLCTRGYVSEKPAPFFTPWLWVTYGGRGNVVFFFQFPPCRVTHKTGLCKHTVATYCEIAMANRPRTSHNIRTYTHFAHTLVPSANMDDRPDRLIHITPLLTNINLNISILFFTRLQFIIDGNLIKIPTRI